MKKKKKYSNGGGVTPMLGTRTPTSVQSSQGPTKPTADMDKAVSMAAPYLAKHNSLGASSFMSVGLNPAMAFLGGAMALGNLIQDPPSAYAPARANNQPQGKRGFYKTGGSIQDPIQSMIAGIKKFNPNLDTKYGEGYTQQLAQLTYDSAYENNLDPYEMLAQMAQESAFKADAGSHAGAQGVSQFMPGTLKRYGITDSADNTQMIPAMGEEMARIISKNMSQGYGDSYDAAQQRYNAGGPRFKQFKAGADIPETADYAKKINQRRNHMFGDQQAPEFTYTASFDPALLNDPKYAVTAYRPNDQEMQRESTNIQAQAQFDPNFMDPAKFKYGGTVKDKQLSSDTVKIQGKPSQTDANLRSVNGTEGYFDHDELVTTNTSQGDFALSPNLNHPKTNKPLAKEGEKIKKAQGKAEQKLEANPYDTAAKNTVKYSKEAYEDLVDENMAQLADKYLNEIMPQKYKNGGKIPSYEYGGPKLSLASIDSSVQPPIYHWNKPPQTGTGLTSNPFLSYFEEEETGLLPIMDKITTQKNDLIATDPKSLPFTMDQLNLMDQFESQKLGRLLPGIYSDYLTNPKPWPESLMPWTYGPNPLPEKPTPQVTPEQTPVAVTPQQPTAPVAQQPAASQAPSTGGGKQAAPKEKKLGQDFIPGSEEVLDFIIGKQHIDKNKFPNNQFSVLPFQNWLKANYPGAVSEHGVDGYWGDETKAAWNNKKYRNEYIKALGIDPSNSLVDPILSGAELFGLDEKVVNANKEAALKRAAEQQEKTLKPVPKKYSRSAANEYPAPYLGDGLQGMEVLSKFFGLAGGPERDVLSQMPTRQIDPNRMEEQARQAYNAQQQSVGSAAYNRGIQQGNFSSYLKNLTDIGMQAANQNKALAAQSDQINLQQANQQQIMNSQNRAAFDAAVQAAFGTVGNVGRGLNKRAQAKEARAYLASAYPDVYNFLMKEVDEQLKRPAVVERTKDAKRTRTEDNITAKIY
jgi:hypothetical protein